MEVRIRPFQSGGEGYFFAKGETVTVGDQLFINLSLFIEVGLHWVSVIGEGGELEGCFASVVVDFGRFEALGNTLSEEEKAGRMLLWGGCVAGQLLFIKLKKSFGVNARRFGLSPFVELYHDWLGRGAAFAVPAYGVKVIGALLLFIVEAFKIVNIDWLGNGLGQEGGCEFRIGGAFCR